jgi:hypothetical protein
MKGLFHMTQADGVISTQRRPAFKIVAGTDSADQSSGHSELTSEPPPRKQKPRKMYKEREPIEYQDGLPIIDPLGEEDEIFRHIAEHRDAIAHYDRCVDVQGDAEGKVSADELAHLQRNTHHAFEQMMLFARCVIIVRPTTRRGLIHQARYLVSQFSDPIGCKSGCTYLPDDVTGQPWPLAFLRSLAAGLRKMGGELDPAPGKEAQS